MSEKAIEIARLRNLERASTSFHLVRTDENVGFRADAAFSLDVIYHLLEDETFEQYMTNLFAAAGSTVVIYAPDKESDGPTGHFSVRWRRFTRWIETHQPGWSLVERVSNPYPEESIAEFFVWGRDDTV